MQVTHQISAEHYDGNEASIQNNIFTLIYQTIIPSQERRNKKKVSMNTESQNFNSIVLRCFEYILLLIHVACGQSVWYNSRNIL